MSAPGQLEQLEDNNNSNMDLQQNNTSEVDELTRISDTLRREGLDLSVLWTMVPVMKDLARKAAKEQFELERENLMQHISGEPSRQGNTSEPRCLHLMFLQDVSSPVLTGTKIKGKGGVSINLALVDSLTREVVKSGPEAAAKVEILALKGDCSDHDGKLEDFNNRIVNKMEGRKSILQGTTTLKLKGGISSIGDLSFTQRARWMRKSKWCLGARAVNSFPGTTIEPAKTESFDLKDNRTKSYAKTKIPSLSDRVSRLKHIGKGITKRLNDEKIFTVKDLLLLLNTNPQRLHKILNVSSKALEEVTDHAKTCIISEEVYMYIDPYSPQNYGVVYDDIGKVKGLLKEYQFFPMNKLSDDEQKYAQKLVVHALDQREKVSKYNDVSSLMECFPQTLGSTSTENPSQSISWDSPLFNAFEQAGIPSYNICINCIGKSSQLGSHVQGLCTPVYSPSYYDDEEFLNFMTFNNQPERLSPDLKPKLSWFIICVSRLFMIRKRVGSLEKNRDYKKQKIS